MQLYQSFQYASAENSESVATSGLESGMIRRRKIVKSFAPSSFADSVISAGRPIMKDFAMIMFQTENISGNRSPAKLFLKFR